MMTHLGYDVALVSFLLVGVGAAMSGCSKDSISAADAAQNTGTAKDPLLTVPAPTSELNLSSPAFTANGAIPKKYTCQGEDVSPKLNISGVPAGTKSLILVVDDPDAPDPAAPKRDFIHWIVFDLDPTTVELPEALSTLPAQARGGLNDWGKATYGGPCPPKGRHRYFFRIYALDKVLELNRPTLGDLRNAVAGHVLGAASLVGTYQKT
jgi:Raf kinase inhibitor-like YbhB/YbcL family protein